MSSFLSREKVGDGRADKNSRTSWRLRSCSLVKKGDRESSQAAAVMGALDSSSEGPSHFAASSMLMPLRAA